MHINWRLCVWLAYMVSVQCWDVFEWCHVWWLVFEWCHEFEDVSKWWRVWVMLCFWVWWRVWVMPWVWWRVWVWWCVWVMRCNEWWNVFLIYHRFCLRVGDCVSIMGFIWCNRNPLWVSHGIIETHYFWRNIYMYTHISIMGLSWCNGNPLCAHVSSLGWHSIICVSAINTLYRCLCKWVQ